MQKNRKKVLTFCNTDSILIKSVAVATDEYGILAQLGEHLPYKQRVIGSSPIGPIDIKEYGEIAQLARAHGSYPWCRGFESPSRYYNEKSVDLNLRSTDFFVQS